MNNVIKSRTDHQVLSFPEEVKLFEEMFKAQDLHVMLAFQQRGDIRLHPRMAHYHRTSTQWRHMKPEQKKEHLRRFYLGLPPKTVPIRSRKYPNVELPADLSKVAKKIGQRKLPKKATTSNHRKKNKTANGVPLKTKRLGEKQTAAENLRDLKNKKKDNREPPKKRPTPKKPPKKQAPKKGPRAKNQQATYETSLHSSDDTGEDVFHSNRLDKQLNPEYSFDSTTSDTDSNASPVKKAPRKTSRVLSSSDSEATQAWKGIVNNQPRTGPGDVEEEGLSDIDEQFETSDIEVIADATPPLRRTTSGRPVVTPFWRLTDSERQRRKEKLEQKKRSDSEATIVHDKPVTGPRDDKDRHLSDISEEFETSDIEDEVEFYDSEEENVEVTPEEEDVEVTPEEENVEVTPPLRRTTSGRPVVTPPWRLTSSAR